jgi:hypothetical protein
MCLGIDEGIEGEIADALTVARATAASRFARELGVDFAHVRCVKRWARALTRQDVWDSHGQDRWGDDLAWSFRTEHGHWPEDHEIEVPDEPPASWTPGEDCPGWEFTERGATGAFPIWVCEERNAVKGKTA